MIRGRLPIYKITRNKKKKKNTALYNLSTSYSQLIMLIYIFFKSIYQPFSLSSTKVLRCLQIRLQLRTRYKSQCICLSCQDLVLLSILLGASAFVYLATRCPGGWLNSGSAKPRYNGYVMVNHPFGYIVVFSQRPCTSLFAVNNFDPNDSKQ